MSSSDSGFAGTFSDGATAAAKPVRVHIEADGLRIVPEDGGATAFWPWRKLRASAPLRRGHPPLIAHEDEPDARLFIADAAIVPLLEERAPQLSRRAHRRRLFWPLAMASLSLALLIALPWIGDFSPARAIAGLLPESLLDGLGRAVIARMSDGRVCADEAGKAALDALLRRLADENPQAARIRVHVARLGVVNAFTAPGGHVVIAAELIAGARTPDEVAGVLAHEMGHAIRRHPEAAIVRAGGLSIIGAVMFGDSGLGNLALTLVRLGYSRQAEREADDIGVQLLRKARIDPAGLIAFFRRMREEHGDGPGGLAVLLRTHPATAERIRRLRRARLENALPALTPAQWRALRHICRRTRPFG